MNVRFITGKIKNIDQKTLFVLGILFIGILVSVIFFDTTFAAIYFIVWSGKVIAGYTRRALEAFGIELISMTVILMGFLYGPVTAFIFAFVFTALMDVIIWVINPPFEVQWPPLIPSPDTLIDGAIGVLAGLMAGSLPFFHIAVICIIAKNILVPLKDSIIYGIPVKPVFIFNYNH